MLFTAKTITGYRLDSRDGEIGKVGEFLFDDKHWAVRYLVAETGSWLQGKQVLLSPYALASVNKYESNIAIRLTRKQIEDSPLLSSDEPVSRQFEEDYYGYYGWPNYWNGPYAWGYYPLLYSSLPFPAPDADGLKETNIGGKALDPDLRSTHDVIGHHIRTQDGEIGHVEDFIIDDETWAIRYLVIDTRNWWPGKRVLISPQWIERISWEDSKVFVRLTLEDIKLAPVFTEDTLITREYETELYRHYGHPGYWIAEQAAKARLL